MNPYQIIERYYEPGSPLYEVLINHSRQVADRAMLIADNLGLPNLEFVEQAALLHDLGIFKVKAPKIHCHGDLPYLCHGVVGRELIESEFPQHALVCERHVGTGITAEQIRAQNLPLPVRDMRPQSVAEQVICYADKFYSKGSGEMDLSTVRSKLAKHGGVTQFDLWQRRFEPHLSQH